MKIYDYIMETEIGNITLACDSLGLTNLSFGICEIPNAKRGSNSILKQAERELMEYLQKKRTHFETPLHLTGTEFQKCVWHVLSTIPYGETRTYAQIAEIIHNPKACRAVGMANHRNPIAIFIPCHRVIGKNGTLTGYAGGLDIKSYLLQLEQ